MTDCSRRRQARSGCPRSADELAWREFLTVKAGDLVRWETDDLGLTGPMSNLPSRGCRYHRPQAATAPGQQAGGAHGTGVKRMADGEHVAVIK